jgi:hypothetical protein
VRGAITLVLAIVILVVVVLDGYSMFAAFMDSRELALGAAQTAAETLQTTGSQGSAQKDADAYVTEHGGELVQLDNGKSVARWYKATVRVEPDTVVFHFIPVVNRFLDQESDASYAF